MKIKRITKKIIGLFTAFAMLFVLPVDPGAYSGRITQSGVYASDTEVLKGQKFTVSVYVPVSKKDADKLDFELKYDKTAFELIGSLDSWKEGLPADCRVLVGDEGTISLSTGDNEVISLSEGLSFTAGFVVRDGAAVGDYEFQLTKHSALMYSFTGLEKEELWEPSQETATVTVGRKNIYPLTDGGIGVSDTEVRRGDVFAVSIDIPAITKTPDTFEVSVRFDPFVFDVETWDYYGSLYSDDYFNADFTYDYESFTVSADCKKKNVDLSHGVRFVATLRVTSDARVGRTQELLLDAHVSYKENGEETSLWSPDTYRQRVTILEGSTPAPVSGNGISVSDTYAAPGDTFNVNIVVPGFIDAEEAVLTAKFDSDAFELVRWTADELCVHQTGGTGYITANVYGRGASVCLSRGLKLTAVLRARKTAAYGKYRIDLTRYSVTDTYGRLLWKPERTYAYVTVGGISPVSAVTGGGISVTSYNVYPEERFTVNITVPPVDAVADSVYMYITYDANAFELVSWYSPLADVYADSGYGYFGLSGGDIRADLSRGFTASAVLIPRRYIAAGTYDIVLQSANMRMLTGYGSEFCELWYPLNVRASVNVFGYTTNLYDYNNNGYYYYTGSYPPYPGWGVPVVTERSTTPAATTTARITERDEPDDYIPPETVPPVETRAPETYIPEDVDDPDDYPYDDPDDAPDDYPDGSPEPENEGESAETTVFIPDRPAAAEVSLDMKLDGLSDRRVVISTKKSFFNGDVTVIMSRPDWVEDSAADALRRLGMSGNKHYSFDISVFNELTGRYISTIKNGYITFGIPVPSSLADSAPSIRVYHVKDGEPQLVESRLENEDGRTVVYFTADSFSPYMLVSIDSLVSAAGSEVVSLNPNTGAVAAVLVPAAVLGCVLLSAKQVRRRKRAKRHVDDDE
ncbi:MAG: hypothetical protein K5876_03240 [Ruminiclostridium sp.]|nr:hypothetical protein [Ruminiclostridium sp.]